MKKAYGIEATISSILFVLLFGVIVFQILGRTSFVTGAVWTEEAGRWIWVWMALIGIGTVERDRAHLRMGFVMELMPARVQHFIGIATDILYLGIACHLVWIGWRTVLRTWDNASVTLVFTDGVLYASCFVAMVIVVYRVLQRLISTIGDHKMPEGEQ